MIVQLRKKLKCQNGFTLVELMVVISIIGVLAAIAVPRYSDVTSNAHGSKVQADLSSIDTAIQMAITQGYKVGKVGDVSENEFVKANMNSIPTPDCDRFRVGNIDYTGVKPTYCITIDRVSVDSKGKSVDIPRAAIVVNSGTFTTDKLGK